MVNTFEVLDGTLFLRSGGHEVQAMIPTWMLTSTDMDIVAIALTVQATALVEELASQTRRVVHRSKNQEYVPKIARRFAASVEHLRTQYKADHPDLDFDFEIVVRKGDYVTVLCKEDLE